MATTVDHDNPARTGSPAPSVKDEGRPVNPAFYLSRMAATLPNHPAVVVTQSHDEAGRAVYASLTFAELEARTNRYANGLSSAGFTRGMRTLVMVRPGFDFISLMFALFKLGAVPVLIDAGMGVRRLLTCIRATAPQGLIGPPVAHALRVLQPRSFGSIERVVTVGRRWFWRGPTLDELSQRAASRFRCVETGASETAAILFTSGSTGPAKGVVYQHATLDAQVRAIRTHYGIKPGEVDLPVFAPFALFSTAMGMTNVIPDMDPTRPARVDPARIVEAIRDHRVTSTFGSPAVWKRVGTYCLDRGIRLPTLRRVLLAGAPVSWDIIDRMRSVLSPGADVHTPYGATEALPVTSISGREVLEGCSLQTRAGAGTCVGKPLPDIDLRLIRITDKPIATWSDDLPVPDGTVGEIAVTGPVVTKEYDRLANATERSKIGDGARIWHRMGDVGYRDKAGRIWFCGRKAHRVMTDNGTMFSVRCEAVFNEHPDVFRSALVGLGSPERQTPMIVIEPEPARFPAPGRRRAFREELLKLARANELTRPIKHVLFHHGFPVDVRHNIKIDREKLAGWVAERSP